MRRQRHALTGAMYEARDDGRVYVEANDGAKGVFDARGTWISGELREADPHLCGWLGGVQLASVHRPTAAARRARDE